MSITQQLAAVLTAPIPFFLAVGAVAGAIWLALEWIYRAVLKKRRELYELSRLEVNHWKDRAETTTKDAVRQIEQLSAELEKEKHLSTQAKVQLDQLKASTTQLTVQLTALGQANSSVTGAARGAGQSLGLSSPGLQRSP
jgi:hypothetical protein